MTDEEIRVLRQIAKECTDSYNCKGCRYSEDSCCAFSGTPTSWLLTTKEDRKAAEVLDSFSNYCNDHLCSNCYVRAACWRMFNTMKFKGEHPYGVEG